MNASPATRTGLIGYGYAGRTFHAPLLCNTPGIDLVAVASSDAGKVHADLPRASVLGSPAALLARDDIDLVVIATPNATHAPLASAALHAGKHVVVDKPFALDLAEARALRELAMQRGRLLSVFQNRRWDSDYLAVSQAIAAGRIGRVTHVESHFDRFRPVVRERWREQAGPGSGIWYDLGPHLIDQALQLFGLPRTVSAHLRIQRSGGHAHDWAHAVLDYGELQVILHASMLVAGGVPRFVVHGDGGSLLKAGADPQESQLLAGMQPGADGWGEDGDPLRLFDGQGADHALPAPAGDQRRYYAGIHAAINGSSANPVPPIQAIAVMAVLEAAIASSRDNRATAPVLAADEQVAWAASLAAA